ncbi:hypothetical protein D3C86_1763720 [compost metagenome]
MKAGIGVVPPGLGRASHRLTPQTRPAVASSKSSLTPSSIRMRVASARPASDLLLIAVWLKAQRACNTTAMMTGLTP